MGVGCVRPLARYHHQARWMRALRQSNRHSHRCCFQLSWRLKFPVYWCHFRPGRHRRHSNWGCPFQPLHCRPRCSNSAIRRPPNPPGGHLQRIRPALRRQRRHCPSLPHPLRRQLRHHGRRYRRPTQIQRAVPPFSRSTNNVGRLAHLHWTSTESDRSRQFPNKPQGGSTARRLSCDRRPRGMLARLLR